MAGGHDAQHGANLPKVLTGRWLPLGIGAVGRLDSPVVPWEIRVQIADLFGSEAGPSSLCGVVSVDATFGYSERVDPVGVLREIQSRVDTTLRKLDQDGGVYFVPLPVVHLGRTGRVTPRAPAAGYRGDQLASVSSRAPT